jgi:thioredoxin-like negative regulator of GroEL
MAMTFRLGACAAALALLVCGGCGDKTTAPSDSTVTVLTDGNFDAIVLQRSGAAMVEFQRPTCPHCQAMVSKVERLAKDYSSRALVGTVNTSVESTLTDRYKIEGVPTFVFFKNGRELSRLPGEQEYSTLATALDAAIAAP